MPHRPSGGPQYAELLDLEPVTGWSCTTQDDQALADFAGAAGTTHPVELPLTIEPGEEAWLDVDLPSSDGGTLLRVEGTQIRVTGWAAGECVGRVWIGDRPVFSGGDPDALWIPAGWPDLTLLVRGLAGKEEPQLSRLCLEFLYA